jgi:hypothetical protein
VALIDVHWPFGGGVSMAGVRYVGGGAEVGVVDQLTPDVFNTLFAKRLPPRTSTT